MTKYWHHSHSIPKYLMAIDRCPKCKTLFEKKRFNVLWHDVLECLDCGNIWVAIDYDEVKKWI